MTVDLRTSFGRMRHAREQMGFVESAPFPNARQVDANTQTSATTINYVISSGTTVTVNGATNVDDDPTTKDLFVKDLTIESGGALVIPAGKRLRVMGTYTDNMAMVFLAQACCASMVNSSLHRRRNPSCGDGSGLFTS